MCTQKVTSMAHNAPQVKVTKGNEDKKHGKEHNDVLADGEELVKRKTSNDLKKTQQQ